MKQSKLLSTSILIVLALLLNGAGKAAANLSQPSQTEDSAKQHDSIASPTPTVQGQATAIPTTTGGATYIYNQYKQPSPNEDFPTWLEAIATIGLLIFAWCQIGFLRRSTSATETAAQAARDAVIATEKYVELTQQLTEATKQSAELAKLALSVGRPYITVTPTDVQPSPIGPQFSFVLRNDGNRPAIIKGIRIAIVWSEKDLCPSYERRVEICSELPARRIHEYVLAPSRDSREYLYWLDDQPPKLDMLNLDELLQAIHTQREQSNRELHLFGFIGYTDPAGIEYGLEFCWNFTVFTSLSTKFFLDIYLDQPSQSSR